MLCKALWTPANLIDADDIMSCSSFVNSLSAFNWIKGPVGVSFVTV